MSTPPRAIHMVQMALGMPRLVGSLNRMVTNVGPAVAMRPLAKPKMKRPTNAMVMSVVMTTMTSDTRMHARAMMIMFFGPIFDWMVAVNRARMVPATEFQDISQPAPTMSPPKVSAT